MTLKYRILPHARRKKLKQLLQEKKGLRIMEAHDGLSGVIAATAVFEDQRGQENAFDGLWISSLTDSAAKGHPDTEVIDTTSRLQTIQEILQVTNKPMIVDGDTGGEDTQFEYFCSKLENLGVSAVVIEDKQFPKRNSLDTGVTHHLEDPQAFANKINRAKASCLSDDFMIFARIESFIAGQDLKDAIKRADIYLDSKADGILIHSKSSSPDEVYAFMEAYQKLCAQKGILKPIICVPTTYDRATDEELFDKGFNIVIYANHLIRAAHKAMIHACQSVLQYKRSFELTNDIASVKALMEIVGSSDVKAKDSKFKQIPTPIIMLASGKPNGFVGTDLENSPISNIPIANKSLLMWQRDTLHQLGLTNITLISGYAKQRVPNLGLNEIYNPDFAATNFFQSLLLAKDQLANGFVMIFGDIFFDQNIIKQLLNIESDILFLVDHSVNLRTRKNIKPTTDLVILKHSNDITLRKPNVLTEQISDIGSDISLEKATHEFIGIAKFSKFGAKRFLETVESMTQSSVNFYQIIKSMIENGLTVDAMEVNRGWSEVHNLTDIAAIEKILNRVTEKEDLSMLI